MRQTYRAVAVRDGRWWFLHVPGEEGLFTQVRRLDQAEAMLREVIGLMRKVPEDSFDVVVEPDLSSIGELRAVIERAIQERERAAAAQDSASAAIRDAVAQMLASGFTTREAGALVGVSPQRISQLAPTGPSAGSPRRAAEEPAGFGEPGPRPLPFAALGASGLPGIAGREEEYLRDHWPQGIEGDSRTGNS